MDKKDIELIKCVILTKKELDIATKNFEQASGKLIDYYAYQIKANKAKLDYLIKEVKEKEISLNMLEEINLRIV